MIEHGCPLCGYETLLFEDDREMCPNGCTVSEWHETTGSSYRPPSQCKNIEIHGVGDIPGTTRYLVLVPTDSDHWTAATAVKEAQQ